MQPRHASTLVSQALNIPDPADQPSPPGDAVECPPQGQFGFMFDDLQEEKYLLPKGHDTVQALVRLGMTMIDKEPLNTAFDTEIPSVYTYFGQFIVHDLTFDPKSSIRLFQEDLESLEPFSKDEITALKNPRSGLLDLDSVYGPMLENDKCLAVPVRNDGTMRVEIAADGTVPGTDLPRGVLPPFKARIGDPRNDENLVLSQLHLAFLRAHNVVVKAGATFEKARALLRRRYQRLVIEDYLPRFVNEADIKWVLENKVFNPEKYFVPVEFSAAAFRFGHALIRSQYHFNAFRKVVQLNQLFTMKVLDHYHHILTDWIVDWTNFVPGGLNVGRNLAPRLVEPLAEFLTKDISVPIGNGQVKKPILSLAVVDLLRGYLFRLPQAQFVAPRLGTTFLPAAEIEKVAEAVSPDQATVLRESGLSSHTPLWYYILAEAAHPDLGNGHRLGPVGGRLLAAVLLEAQRRSTDELKEDGWDPILGEEKGFNLAELLAHARI